MRAGWVAIGGRIALGVVFARRPCTACSACLLHCTHFLPLAAGSPVY
jgi:Fe-S-cluster-containing dehydrogenase component